MNKSLTFSILGLITGASSLIGAMDYSPTYQYGDYVEYDYQNPTVKERSLTVVRNGNLTLNFSNGLYAPSYSITNWETLNVEITDGTTGQKTIRDVAITGTSVDIGDFLSGNSLYFYVTGKQGTTFPSVENYIGDFRRRNEPSSLFFEGNYGSGGSQYTQLSFEIHGAPSGQPLPGVAVSMLMGSAGLYLVKRKKASKTAC